MPNHNFRNYIKMLFLSKLYSHNKRTFIFGFWLGLMLGSFTVSAQMDKMLTPVQMKKDLKQLQELLEAHPDPYTYLGEEAFKKYWQKCELAVEKQMTHLDFYKIVSSIVGLVHDGHTSVKLPNYWLENQQKITGSFPLKLYLTNKNELFVLKDYNQTPIPTGAQILSINQISIDSFISMVDPYISYETKNFRNTLIDNQFEKYLYLAYGKSDSTVIEYFVEKKNIQL